jgi:hypothetical protein
MAAALRSSGQLAVEQAGIVDVVVAGNVLDVEVAGRVP